MQRILVLCIYETIIHCTYHLFYACTTEYAMQSKGGVDMIPKEGKTRRDQVKDMIDLINDYLSKMKIS